MWRPGSDDDPALETLNVPQVVYQQPASLLNVFILGRQGTWVYREVLELIQGLLE